MIPCATIEKMQHETKMGRAFSFVEMREFFIGIIHDNNLNDIQKKYYIFVWLTGIRRNEALGIKKKDVDFENKILSIHGTKTNGSDRDVPLTPLVENLHNPLLVITTTISLYLQTKQATWAVSI